MLNASLVDICMGSLATPTYFPPHCFETKNSNGESTEFTLVGPIIANNPTIAALADVPIEARARLVVLSLGTCTPKYNSKKAKAWEFYKATMSNALRKGVATLTGYDWLLYHQDSWPEIGLVHNNYLRIQVYHYFFQIFFNIKIKINYSNVNWYNF
ncbi:PREDICTED: patatin-like protein 1 [Erythranthe guttata]|uniref:patatin-like protein 1 n=1 Tax=Erythranthe guttata TaxID=4155 RepID=UPI00064E0325|nr:PREDICTED: patatin-like protein 1 [Erythranthe guttata]|eukprot:XP_012841499.1 PREDICTED: patatin-like protein 1 [Erythranthe guttata]